MGKWETRWANVWDIRYPLPGLYYLEKLRDCFRRS